MGPLKQTVRPFGRGGAKHAQRPRWSASSRCWPYPMTSLTTSAGCTSFLPGDSAIDPGGRVSKAPKISRLYRPRPSKLFLQAYSDLSAAVLPTPFFSCALATAPMQDWHFTSWFQQHLTSGRVETNVDAFRLRNSSAADIYGYPFRCGCHRVLKEAMRCEWPSWACSCVLSRGFESEGTRRVR